MFTFYEIDNVLRINLSHITLSFFMRSWCFNCEKLYISYQQALISPCFFIRKILHSQQKLMKIIKKGGGGELLKGRCRVGNKTFINIKAEYWVFETWNATKSYNVFIFLRIKFSKSNSQAKKRIRMRIRGEFHFDQWDGNICYRHKIRANNSSSVNPP